MNTVPSALRPVVRTAVHALARAFAAVCAPPSSAKKEAAGEGAFEVYDGLPGIRRKTNGGSDALAVLECVGVQLCSARVFAGG